MKADDDGVYVEVYVDVYVHEIDIRGMQEVRLDALKTNQEERALWRACGLSYGGIKMRVNKKPLTPYEALHAGAQAL